MSGPRATRASSRVKRSTSNVVSAPMDLRMRSAQTGRSSMPREGRSSGARLAEVLLEE